MCRRSEPDEPDELQADLIRAARRWIAAYRQVCRNPEVVIKIKVYVAGGMARSFRVAPGWSPDNPTQR
jgi:hypothetical protein